MWLDPKRYEIVDDEMAEVLRRKTPAERLEMAHSMWRLARDLIRASVLRIILSGRPSKCRPKLREGCCAGKVEQHCWPRFGLPSSRF